MRMDFFPYLSLIMILAVANSSADEIRVGKNDAQSNDDKVNEMVSENGFGIVGHLLDALNFDDDSLLDKVASDGGMRHQRKPNFPGSEFPAQNSTDSGTTHSPAPTESGNATAVKKEASDIKLNPDFNEERMIRKALRRNRRKKLIGVSAIPPYQNGGNDLYVKRNRQELQKVYRIIKNNENNKKVMDEGNRDSSSENFLFALVILAALLACFILRILTAVLNNSKQRNPKQRNNETTKYTSIFDTEATSPMDCCCCCCCSWCIAVAESDSMSRNRGNLRKLSTERRKSSTSYRYSAPCLTGTVADSLSSYDFFHQTEKKHFEADKDSLDAKISMSLENEFIENTSPKPAAMNIASIVGTMTLKPTASLDRITKTACDTWKQKATEITPISDDFERFLKMEELVDSSVPEKTQRSQSAPDKPKKQGLCCCAKQTSYEDTTRTSQCTLPTVNSSSISSLISE